MSQTMLRNEICKKRRTREYSSQSPLCRSGNRQVLSSEREDSEDLRLPWIHSREPIDIQSSDMLSPKNYAARSLVVSLGRNMVIYRGVRPAWGREPFSRDLLYLIPCGEASVSMTEAMEVAGHEQYILPTFRICCMAFQEDQSSAKTG